MIKKVVKLKVCSRMHIEMSKLLFENSFNGFDGASGRKVLNFVEKCLKNIGDEAKKCKNVIHFENSFG